MEAALPAPDGYSLVLAPVAEGWHTAPVGCRFWAEQVRFLGIRLSRQLGESVSCAEWSLERMLALVSTGSPP